MGRNDQLDHYIEWDCLARVGQITRRGALPPPGLFRVRLFCGERAGTPEVQTAKGAPGEALGPIEDTYETCPSFPYGYDVA